VLFYVNTCYAKYGKCMYVSFSSFLHTCMHACLQASRKRARKMLKAFSAGVHSSFFVLPSASFFLQTCLPLSISSILLQSACGCAECRVHSLPLLHFYRSSLLVSRFSPLFQSLLQLFSPQASAIASHFLLSQRRSRKRKTGPQRGKTRE